jgi:hypothetical protein
MNWPERRKFYGESFFTKTCIWVTDGQTRRPDVTDLVRFLLARSENPKSVMDCGCAVGGVVSAIRAVCPETEVWGFDLSEYAIEHALPEVKDAVSLLDCAEEPIPYPDRHFGLCIAMDFYEHQDDDHMEFVVAETTRVTSGYIFIRQPFVHFNVPDIDARIELIKSYNHLSHKERLALIDAIPEITTSIPDPDCLYHPGERGRGFFIDLFRKHGFGEQTLPENDYIFPNCVTITSWTTLFLKRT